MIANHVLRAPGAALAFLLMIAAPAQGQEKTTPRQCPASASAGVQFSMTEKALDGNYPVCPGEKRLVDANADLVVTFRTPTLPAGEEVSPEQKRLIDLLKEVKDIGDEVAGLSAGKVDPSDPEAVKKLHENAVAVGNKVSVLLGGLQKFGLNRKEVTDIPLGTFPGGSDDPDKPYQNLALWIDIQLQKLDRDVEIFVQNKDKIGVQVAAFRDSLSGERKQLHVENYDDLPAGELRPIDRLGLRLTSEERDQFNKSLAGNERIAGLVRDIQSDRDKIEGDARTFMAKVRDRLSKLEEKLKGEAASFHDGLNAALDSLRQVSGANPDAVKDLVAQVKALEGDFETMRSVEAGLEKLRDGLSGAGGEGLVSLLTRKDGLFDQLESFKKVLQAALDSAKDAPERLKAIKERVQELGNALKTEVAESLTSSSLEKLLDFLSEEMPSVAVLVEEIKPILDPGERQVEGAETLADFSSSTTRGLEDLPDGTIDLERAEWIPGDRVTVSVRFIEKRAAQLASAPPPKILHEESFKVEAVLMGVHRELASAVIFARALNGSVEATKWKPNVAALVSWLYHVRDPQGSGRFWNWLNMGFGVHLASLDQGQDSVEFGVGANLTFWGGLVSAGFGYNLSVDRDRPYEFIGIDLFDALNRHSKTVPAK